MMMNRDIKFRVWDGIDYMSTPFTLMDLQLRKIELTSDLPVMQYTGLKDKNGKEIYEGDILKESLLNGIERFYKIWREKGGFVINIYPCDFKKDINYINFYDGIADMQSGTWIEGSLEVIGNKFENPELLKLTNDE